MSPFEILPLQPLRDRNHNSWKQGKESRSHRPTDIKIHDQIMPRVCLSMLKEGSLLATALAPPIQLTTIQEKKEENCFILPRRKRPKLIVHRTRVFPNHYFPIGLKRVFPHSWINALMQFVLFIPILREIFAYTPPSLSPFNEFIEQYFLDLDERQFLFRGDGFELIRCLFGKFPKMFQNLGIINLYEWIRILSQSAEVTSSIDSFYQILWDAKKDLYLDELLNQSSPSDLLIGLSQLYDPALQKNSLIASNPLPKQYLATQIAVCYDLDAFVEYRKVDEEEGYYYTYLKIDGTWVQCVDERILPLRRSSFLEFPIRRGILFHYRRIWIG